MAKTRDFSEVIRRKLASNRQLAAEANDEYLRMSVAEQIYSARRQAGMTQRQLADACGMKQSAIARLESTDYEGHKLDTVRRVAAALNLRVELVFAPPVEAGQFSMSESSPRTVPSSNAASLVETSEKMPAPQKSRPVKKRGAARRRSV